MVGSQDGVAIMEAFFDAYNERRVDDVSKLEHDDIELLRTKWNDCERKE